MNTSWVRSGSGPAHVVVATGSDTFATACNVTIWRNHARRVKTMLVETNNVTHTRPANCDPCPACLDAAIATEM